MRGVDHRDAIVSLARCVKDLATFGVGVALQHAGPWRGLRSRSLRSGVGAPMVGRFERSTPEAALARPGLPLGSGIGSSAELAVFDRPAFADHGLAKVVARDVALGDHPAIAVSVFQPAIHGSAADQGDQALTRHVPASEATTSGVLADLEAFGCIYARQPNALAAEREGVTIDDVRRGRGGDETESEQGKAVAKPHC